MASFHSENGDEPHEPQDFEVPYIHRKPYILLVLMGLQAYGLFNLLDTEQSGNIECEVWPVVILVCPRNGDGNLFKAKIHTARNANQHFVEVLKSSISINQHFRSSAQRYVWRLKGIIANDLTVPGVVGRLSAFARPRQRNRCGNIAVTWPWHLGLAETQGSRGTANLIKFDVIIIVSSILITTLLLLQYWLLLWLLVKCKEWFLSHSHVCKRTWVTALNCSRTDRPEVFLQACLRVVERRCHHCHPSTHGICLREILTGNQGFSTMKYDEIWGFL